MRAFLDRRSHDLNSNPLPQEGLCLFVFLAPRDRFVLLEDGIALTDSEGFRFPLKRISESTKSDGMADRGPQLRILFRVDRESLLQRIRHDDPAYYLTLRAPFSFDGQQGTLIVPRIAPTLQPGRIGPDTYPGALVLWLCSMVLLGLVTAGVALGIRALVARVRAKRK